MSQPERSALFPLEDIPELKDTTARVPVRRPSRRITDAPDPRRRLAPLRVVVGIAYTSLDGGVTQTLECGHTNVKPRRSHNFEVERARCLTCLLEGDNG